MSRNPNSNMESYESAIMKPEYQAKVEQMVREAPAWTEIPPVLPLDMKQMWEATRRINEDTPPRPGVQIGAGVLAAYGVDAAAEPERLMAASMRNTVLLGIIERGALKEYLHDEGLTDNVFAAMATIACTKDDMLQALLPQTLSQLSADDADKLRAATKAHGYDPENPSIDAKLIKFLRDSSHSI